MSGFRFFTTSEVPRSHGRTRHTLGEASSTCSGDIATCVEAVLGDLKAKAEDRGANGFCGLVVTIELPGIPVVRASGCAVSWVPHR